MANTCGELRFLEGGTITDSTILNSTVTNSVVSNSTVDTASVTNLTSIDSASAAKIAEALANLSQSQLQQLADAIMALLTARSSSAATGIETQCTDGVLPGVVISNVGVDAVLGRPDSFAPLGDGFVPVYDSPCQDV